MSLFFLVEYPLYGVPSLGCIWAVAKTSMHRHLFAMFCFQVLTQDGWLRQQALQDAGGAGPSRTGRVSKKSRKAEESALKDSEVSSAALQARASEVAESDCMLTRTVSYKEVT